MNIDDYLNDLQTNLDEQLSRFGVSDQPARNMFSTEDVEEKKFCPECGNKVAADAKFCPECGYKFDTADEAAENSNEQEQTAPAKRKFKVSFACRPYLFVCASRRWRPVPVVRWLPIATLRNRR